MVIVNTFMADFIFCEGIKLAWVESVTILREGKGTRA